MKARGSQAESSPVSQQAGRGVLLGAVPKPAGLRPSCLRAQAGGCWPTKASYSCWGGFPNSPRRVPSHSTQTWGSPSSDSGSGFLISKASVTLQCSQRNILPLIKARWERVGAKKGFFFIVSFRKGGRGGWRQSSRTEVSR